MHALIEWVETVVVALAIAAFAHFGVSLKEPPRHSPDQIVRKVSVSSSTMQTADDSKPCPLTRRVTRT